VVNLNHIAQYIKGEGGSTDKPGKGCDVRDKVEALREDGLLDAM
jgi:hypothetical protein